LNLNHMMYSTSKSVTSLAIGLCIEEGLLGLDDCIVDFFPELITGPLHEFNRIRTVRNLLCMQSGETGDTTAIDRSYPNWLKSFLNTPPRTRPGALFGYDSGATHALSALVERVSGQKLIDYLRPRLFDPLGIDDTIYWEQQMGITVGSRGLHMKTRDMLKIGQMMLQDGMWNGKQIISKEYLRDAVTNHNEVAHTSNLIQGNIGYGYQFWNYRDGAYGTRAIGGQNIVVYPKEDVVFGFTANCTDGFGSPGEVIHMIWSLLFDHISDKPLKENPAAYQELLNIEAGLDFPIPHGLPTRSKTEERLHGKKYIVAKNSAQIHDITFLKTETGLRLEYTMCEDERKWKIDACFGDWQLQPITVTNDEGWARYVWRNENFLEVIVLIKEQLGMYRLAFSVGEDNSICIDMYPVGWRDFNRSIELFAMGYHHE